MNIVGTFYIDICGIHFGNIEFAIRNGWMTVSARVPGIVRMG
jgi:hypothetical protein